MIHTVECFTLECDNCKEDYTNEHSGFSIFNDKNSLLEDADDWHEQDGKHYCPNCAHIDDEDNLIIKPKTIKND